MPLVSKHLLSPISVGSLYLLFSILLWGGLALLEFATSPIELYAHLWPRQMYRLPSLLQSASFAASFAPCLMLG